VLSDFFQVRGTPASGKTTLSQLLCEHVTQQGKRAVWIGHWPIDDVRASGGYLSYLQQEYNWNHTDDDEETVFVFDEGQTSYWDTNLWNQFLKSIHGYDNRWAIIFACYGSPTTSMDPIITPIHFADTQRITLRAVPQQDGLPSVGLFLSREEFEDLVQKMYPKQLYHFHSSVFEAIYNLTVGHVGAIHDSISVVLNHPVCPILVSESNNLTLHFSPIVLSRSPPSNRTLGTFFSRQ
jgi:hypothetical protein